MDIIIFQAEFVDWRKMLIGELMWGLLQPAKKTHCVMVECEQVVLFSEVTVAHRQWGNPRHLGRQGHCS